MHTPVLLKEAIESLAIKQEGKYIDATFGEGGHTREILKRGGHVLALDFDENNIKQKQIVYSNEKDLSLVVGNFADIEKIAKEYDFVSVDGVLFDLGLSMEQISKGKRGFSFKKHNEPLDMRINSKLPLMACDILMTRSQNELEELFIKNAEELLAKPIADAIVRARKNHPIKTVGDLVSIIETVAGKQESPVKRIFQALRIEVNQEFENLRKGLNGAVNILSDDGKIAIITFHSLEDRIVKQFVLKNNLRFVNKKAITSKRDTSFEKTAKLRVIAKHHEN